MNPNSSNRTKSDGTSPYIRPVFIFDNMKSEQQRLNTFTGQAPQWPVSFIKPEDCAKAGFFFLRDGDKVQCAFCRGVAGEWEPGDDPIAEHKRHFPRCPFMCKLPVGNIPLGVNEQAAATRLQEEQQVNLIGVDVCGPFEPVLRPYAGPDEDGVHVRGAQPLRADMEEVTNSLAIRTGNGPVRKQLVTYEKRLETFVNWPASESGQSAQAMAEAGFYHIGISDHVKCFYCDGGLRNWESNDDPWAEHSRWFPQCPFVLLNKVRDDKKQETVKKEEIKKEDAETHDPLMKVVKTDCFKTEVPSSSASTSKEQNEEVNETSSESTTSERDRKSRELEEEVRKLKEAKQCKICMDNEADVVFLPCGHLISCVRCATALSTCALCRQQIKAVVRTYMA